MAVRADVHAGGRSVGEFAHDRFGPGLHHDHHGVAVDRRFAVEQPAEMLDVSDADHSPLELVGLDDAEVTQDTADRRIALALGVVDRPTIEVQPNERIGGEGDLAGVRMEAGDVERGGRRTRRGLRRHRIVGERPELLGQRRAG